MIIEKLAKLDKSKRISTAVLVLLVAAYVCYYAINRDSVAKLQAVKANYDGNQAAYVGIENQQTDLTNLQKQLEDKEKQFEKQQRQCFGGEQAVQFFKNINSAALAYNLKPISRTISEPKKLVTDKKIEPEEQFLQTQSAKVAVVGNYFSVVDFVSELVNRPEKICIRNLHIALPPGEKFDPVATFTVDLLIDISKGQ